jgi:hypothetical protein
MAEWPVSLFSDHYFPPFQLIHSLTSHVFSLELETTLQMLHQGMDTVTSYIHAQGSTSRSVSSMFPSM